MALEQQNLLSGLVSVKTDWRKHAEMYNNNEMLAG